MEDKNKIKDKVSEILKKKQESKEFKDTNIVGYTKKYKRNYDIVNSNNLSEIEDDPINAYKQVEKSKVWQEYNIEEQKEKGYSSGATYLKVKCRESLSSRPFDSKDARNVYVTNIERLKIILEGCFTAKSVEDELYKFIRNKDFFVGDTSDLDGKSWQYSRKIDKKLTSIFGVRFINFCKRHSDSAIADFKKAELFDPYTKEQQDEYINKELIRLNKLLIEKNNDLEEAKNKSKEHIERQVRSKYAHLFTSRKAFDEKVLSDFEGLKKIYLSGYENQVKFTVQAIESYTQRKDLKDQYVVRDNNWDWAFGENQQIERKKSNSPKINTKLPLSHITRTGGYEIPSIEVDSVTKTFGFNNVVFGNTLKDTESREHIKHFLGAITDLAEMLDIDIFAINQLGKLDINFATMGVAGHMATYFPAYKAINLTKKSGDGSVAHEWFHYFDNVIQEGSERRATSVLASESCSQNSMGTKLAIWNLVNYILKGDGETNQITVRFEAQDKVRYHAYSDTLEGCIEEIQERYKIYAYKYDDPSVIKYYGFLAHKFQKAYIDVPMTLKTSIYYYNSSRIGSKYWVEPAELCARAFESYIEAILDLKDRKNNYLVSYKNNWIFTPQDEIPYPRGRELEKIIVLFDNIFKAFKQEYNVSDFKPFSEKRVSEYIEIKDNSKKEKTTKTDTDMPIMERLPQSVEEIKTENLPSNDVVSMDVLPNTKENNAKIKALKTIENTVGKIFWTGNTTHDNLDKCLTALNLDSANSGWYKPKAAKIKGLKGYYMINQDGSLFCEARVIKQEENKYLIEYLTNEGWNKFENLYSENLDDYQEEIKTENLPIEETQYVANISNDVPTAESKQRFSTVKEIDRTQITTSPKDFQGRQHAYSEESVNKIVSEGFDKTNDPIVVWYDKTIDKYIVISGHSRFEASRRLYEAGDKSLQTMPVKEFLGDKDEAVSYAVLESNRASTQEGLISDINAVRKMLKDGYNKSEMIKYVKPQSYLENIIRYTYLNPNGKFVEYLASPSKSSFPYLERNASWVGDLRKMYSEKLTDLHESEIFDYIYNSGTSKGLKLSKEQLYNLIGSKIMKLDYDNQKPLNLNNIVSTNTIVSPAREKINEMKSDVDYWQKEIQKKQDLIVRARLENNQDLVSKFQTFISDATARVLDIKEKIQKLESEINTVQNSVVRDLFSQVEKTEEIAKIEADYSVYEADKVQNEIEEDIKSDIDNCNNELISFSKQYEKEILQVDSKITINGIDYIVVFCDSEKVKLKQSFGKYNNQEIILTYNEMVEMFSKGKISFDGYSKEDSSLFDLMIKTKQICLIKEGSLNSIKGIANYSVQKISDMAIAIKELSEAKQSIQKQLEQAENEIQENTVNLLDFDDVSKKIIAKKLQKIQDFMNPAQLSIVKGSNEFDDVINSLYKIIAQTPEIYGTQTVSLHEKIAYLHYFYGGSDWYIIELNKKDIFDENLTIEEPAFGYAILNGDLQMAEFGYIDINELKQFGAELDFHFEPTPMYKLFPNEFEAPMQEIEPATETEQPKETTVDDLKMRIKTIERMIKKGVGDKTQLEMRIKTINRMIAKKQK